LGRAGTWDLRVKVDGMLVGMLDFSMSTASNERSSATDSEGELRTSRPAPRERLIRADDDDGAPVSLEDLLREQARRSESRGNG